VSPVEKAIFLLQKIVKSSCYVLTQIIVSLSLHSKLPHGVTYLSQTSLITSLSLHVSSVTLMTLFVTSLMLYTSPLTLLTIISVNGVIYNVNDVMNNGIGATDVTYSVINVTDVSTYQVMSLISLSTHYRLLL